MTLSSRTRRSKHYKSDRAVLSRLDGRPNLRLPGRRPAGQRSRALRSGLRIGLICLICFAALSSCKTFFRPEIPTGIERHVLENGNMELIVTGRASKNAIDKDSTAMKQTTSREAARLLLEAELQSGSYPDHKERFEIQSVEFLYDFEYCRMKGTYKKK